MMLPAASASPDASSSTANWRDVHAALQPLFSAYSLAAVASVVMTLVASTSDGQYESIQEDAAGVSFQPRMSSDQRFQRSS
eukprot:1782728-Prymnesium_polylepis.1